jgi:tripartite-type tricarboxylate transporter receptor subunit TctC
MLMGTAIYHAGAAPHLFGTIPRAVVVPEGTPERVVERLSKAQIKAARKEEKR